MEMTTEEQLFRKKVCLLDGKINVSHAHKTGIRCLLGVPLKNSDGQHQLSGRGGGGV